MTLYPVYKYGSALSAVFDTLEPDRLPALEPVARPRRLNATVADSLRSLILDGSVAPGTPIRQEELARQLGVSRTPLREALVRLEAEGLVRFTSTGKATVTAISAGAALELLEMRELVDGLAARKLAQRGLDDREHEALLDVTTDMETALSQASKALYLRANTEFHVRIAELTEHSQLLPHLPLIRLASEVVYLNRTRDDLERMTQAVGEHRAIVAAIHSRDPETAERLARVHIKNAGDHWVAQEPSQAANGAESDAPLTPKRKRRKVRAAD